MRVKFGFTGPVVAGAVVLALLPGALAGPAATLPSSSAPAAAAPYDLDDAVSHPRADSVYPDVGHREIDALSYDLDLTWDRKHKMLTGRAAVVFRAATTAPRIALDFGTSLRATRVTFDGRRVPFVHRGKNLVIDRAVVKDDRHTLRIAYRGHPRAVPWPTERSDGTKAGWLVDRNGWVGTLQEPYGAYTWYPVNDHPSDKAFYTVTITAPPGWTGISNGELVSRAAVTTPGRPERTVTRWRMDRPAASYLVTVAIGDYTETSDTSASGVPITYWTATGSDRQLAKVRETASALDWLEARLGPYPFDTLGVVVIRSRSAMETQSTITLGNGDYSLSKPVIVHELAHQWYGDLVTPTDWSDFWMNEGMAMHLQDTWVAENDGRALFAVVREREQEEWWLRQAYGPPANYRANAFGMSNVYYGAELMWDDVLRRVGWERYWQLVREWPHAHPYGNATYDQIVGWWSSRTGLDRDFFDRWLLRKRTPKRIALAFPAPGAGGRADAGQARRSARDLERRAGARDLLTDQIRSAVIRAAARLDAYAAKHDGVYPDYDEGTAFATRVLAQVDDGFFANYIHDETRTSYCLFPGNYYGVDLDFVYDSQADALVDAPGHRFPVDSLCGRLWPVLERTQDLSTRSVDLVSLISEARDAPATLAELRASRDADSGYLFPRGPAFEIGDYAWLGGEDRAEFRVCVLDDQGGAVTYTTDPPLEPPYQQWRTFLYDGGCTYAE